MHDKDEKILNILKTSKGQLEGVIRMVEDDRYCVDVSKQILAVQALLKKANMQIIDRHIKSCVRQAFEEGMGDEKIDEVMEIIDRYAK